MPPALAVPAVAPDGPPRDGRPFPAPLPPERQARETWPLAALVVWVVGLQLSEPVATAGLALCGAGWLVASLREGASGLREGLRRWWPLWLWLTWAVLAPVLGGRLPSGSGLARLLDWAAIPAAVWALGRVGRRRGTVLLWLAAAALIASSVVAGLQHYGMWPRPEAHGLLQSLKVPVHRLFEPIPGAEGRYMGLGLLFHRLKYAHVGSLVVLALLAFGLHAQGRDRWLALGAALFGLGSILVFPYARAASAALVVACAAVIVLTTGHRRRALIAAGVLVLIGVGAIAGKASLRARFMSSLTQTGSGDRSLLVGSGLTALEQHPVLGLGAGRFRAMDWVPQTAPVHVREQRGKAHNQLLSIAVEHGVPGLLLFAFMLVSLLRRMRPATAGGAVGYGAVLFFLLLGFTHDPLFQAPFSMALVLAVGVGVGASAGAFGHAGPRPEVDGPAPRE